MAMTTTTAPPARRYSRLLSWLEGLKMHTHQSADAEETRSGSDESAYKSTRTPFPQHTLPEAEARGQVHFAYDTTTNRISSLHLFDLNFSFHQHRRRFSSLATTASSKRNSTSDGSTQPPPTASTAPSTATTARTSVSTTPPHPSFPCLCQMPVCALCQLQQHTLPTPSPPTPGSVTAGRQRAERAKRFAPAFEDSKAFRVVLMRKKDGFSVAEERSADGILTPRTARFQEGLVVTRSAVSWAQTEERLRYENIDYKAEKVAENARQAAERERWARESALTGYLAEADTEDLAPDQRPRGRRPAGMPVVRKYGYNIFKDEDENGFLAYEPL